MKEKMRENMVNESVKEKEFTTFENWFVDWLGDMTNEFSGNFDEACREIHHHNKAPFDSFDRIFTLWLIDQHFEIVENFDIEKAKVSKEYCENYFNENIKQYEGILDEWDSNTDRAYDNYEREAISDVVAFINMLAVAKKGPDVVLKDSYYDGGWFGAS